MSAANSVFEWTIENFSCWNNEIHGNMIQFPSAEVFCSSRATISLKFFPKGISGNEKHLLVKIWNPFVSGDCELSFIGSNGSLICKESRRINEYNFEDFTGPAFERVIHQIRKNEALHTDSLTLRIRITICFFVSLKLLTVIDMFSTSVKVNCGEFCTDDSSSLERFSQIQYQFEEDKRENLDFYIAKESSTQEEVNLNFELKSHFLNKKKTLARIRIFYQQSNEDMLKHEEAEHIFSTERKDWISKKSLPVKIDGTEKVTYVILNIKIITGNDYKTYFHWSPQPDKTEIALEDTKKIPRKGFSNHLETSVDVLTKEMMSLFQDSDYADFQLRCGQHSFDVHKGILSARSPVFKNLLASDMKEASSGVMDIVDLDAPTLGRFLGFLYSGTVKDLERDIALKLYYAADKYEVSTLKEECAWVLSAHLSISNVCEILSLADRHQDKQLTSVAHDFISVNYDQVLKSKEWMGLAKVDPDLHLKTLAHFAQKDHVGKMDAS